MTAYVLQTFQLLTHFKVRDSASPRLHGSYSKRVSMSKFGVFTDADCNGLVGRLAQGLGSKIRYFFGLLNLSGLRARCAYDGGSVIINHV